MEGHAWGLFLGGGSRRTCHHEKTCLGTPLLGTGLHLCRDKTKWNGMLGTFEAKQKLRGKKKPEVKTCEAKKTFRSKKPLRYNQPLEVKQKKL